ncbi:Structural maintenance of chromosomes protein 5 [Rhodotorula kratochvilovae]
MSDSDGDAPMRPVKPEPANARRSKPRAVQSDDEDPASDEDQHRQAKRVKRERSNKGKQKARVQDSDDDEDQQDPQDDDDDGASPGGDGDEEDDDLGPDERQHLVRHDDGYVTGSIVRIACHSFLTYDSVEFRPGPALNMIIGPNGTGKSTIACAIAIGLGFPAKVLGRSTKLSAYCKNDSNEATWIEIELKGKPGQKNLVVKRHLSRDSEKTHFELDGKDATAKDVAEQMEELQVQIGNLCTFLPQDRVASFAMMSPPELLRETQHAAGNENLTRWHQVLIGEWKRCKEAQKEVDRLSEGLKRKHTKQAETEKEVRAFEQRERLEQDRAVADVLVKFASYNQIYGDYQAAREEKTTVKNEVDALEAKNKPFRESKAALEALVRACKAEQDKVEKRVALLLKDADQYKKKFDELDDQREEVADKINDIKKREAARRKAIDELRKDIDKYSAIVANEPAEADTSDLDRQFRDKSNQRNEIANQMRENENERDGIYRQGNEHKRVEQAYLNELQKQQEVKVQRERNLEHFDLPTWRAVQWLRQNGDKMRGRVFEPARLHLSVKKDVNGMKLDMRDSSLVDLVEAPVPMSGFSTFLFEFREDYDRMMNILVDEPNRRQPGSGLKINGAECDADLSPSAVPRPLSNEQLDALGFDCMAVDLLDGPPAVLAWLCTTHNLHRVPVQIRRRPVDAQAIEQGRAIQRYYTREGSNSIKFSMYGNRYAQVEVRNLKRAKILSSGVDHSKVDQCNRKIEEARNARQALKVDIDKLEEVYDELGQQVKQLDNERDQLNEEKKKAQKARVVWVKAVSKLEIAQGSLKRAQAHPSAEQQRATLTAQLRTLVERRVKSALGYTDAVAKAAELQEGAIKVHLQALQADSDHRAMDAMVREKDEELEEKKAQLEEVSIRLAALLKEGKKLMTVANDALNATDGEVRERIDARREEGKTLDELDEELREIETNLSCMGAVSPMVLEAYNKRKLEIADQKEKLDDAEARLDESKQVIEGTEKRWLPRLERLVSDISAKFTSSFDTLGLLGEVRLAKDEDYEKWGIEIMVSFRDRKDNSEDVALHVLSGHRQSGGERALTTVTYLLALAELARAPFALVDEINQGMDQRAERNMHKMLVETTCSHDVGQYFLLTPKLLPDLVYHPKMKVLVINVSPYVPGNLSLQDILARKRQAMRGEKRPRAVMAN